MSSYAGSSMTLDNTSVANCSAIAASRSRSARGGNLFAHGGVLLLTRGSMLRAGFASTRGASLYIIGGLVTYLLPTPPGHWAAAITCVVYRQSCPQDSFGVVLDPQCTETATACSHATNSR